MERFSVFCTKNNSVTEGAPLPFTCLPPLLQIAPSFFPLAFVRLPLSSHSSSEPTPCQAERPRGSNQLNYWEHKNAATNGSWINTLAKLLLWLPLLPRGIRTEILRLRTPCLEDTVEIFVCGGSSVVTSPGPWKDVVWGFNLKTTPEQETLWWEDSSVWLQYWAVKYCWYVIIPLHRKHNLI